MTMQISSRAKRKGIVVHEINVMQRVGEMERKSGRTRYVRKCKLQTYLELAIKSGVEVDASRSTLGWLGWVWK